MSGSKPSGSSRREPSWVEKARARGSNIERVSGTFVIVETDDPPWTREEAADRDPDAQDSNEHVAVPASADGK